MLILEYVVGQFELMLYYGDVMQVVENLMVLKYFLCGVVCCYGMQVCFMVKFFVECFGFGMYLYVSLIDCDGCNFFVDCDGVFLFDLFGVIGGFFDMVFESMLVMVLYYNLWLCFVVCSYVLIMFNWGINYCGVVVCVLVGFLGSWYLEQWFVGVDVNFFFVVVVMLEVMLCGMDVQCDFGLLIDVIVDYVGVELIGDGFVLLCNWSDVIEMV